MRLGENIEIKLETDTDELAASDVKSAIKYIIIILKILLIIIILELLLSLTK